MAAMEKVATQLELAKLAQGATLAEAKQASRLVKEAVERYKAAWFGGLFGPSQPAAPTPEQVRQIVREMASQISSEAGENARGTLGKLWTNIVTPSSGVVTGAAAAGGDWGGRAADALSGWANRAQQKLNAPKELESLLQLKPQIDAIAQEASRYPQEYWTTEHRNAVANRNRIDELSKIKANWWERIFGPRVAKAQRFFKPTMRYGIPGLAFLAGLGIPAALGRLFVSPTKGDVALSIIERLRQQGQA